MYITVIALIKIHRAKVSTLNHTNIMVNLSHELCKELNNTIMIKFKIILFVLFLLPLNALSSTDPFASSGLTNVIAINNTIAGVVWDFQMTLIAGGSVISDPNPTDNKFYAPTVLFFNGANGNLIKKMTFFGDDCPYSPVSLVANGATIKMIVQVLPMTTNSINSGGSLPTTNYPSCRYTDSVTTLQEIRNLKTGELIKQITLQNYRTAIFP